MARLRWSVAVVLLLAAGCAAPGQSPSPTTTPPDAGSPGTEQPGTEQPGDDPGATAGTELVITLDESGSGSTRTFTLTCDPVGGDHPDPEAACAALADVGVGAFAPVPRDVACTDLWGGPQVATVRGTVDGQPVQARFDRTNGCEISRWDTLVPLLGSRGGA